MLFFIATSWLEVSNPAAENIVKQQPLKALAQAECLPHKP
jgi:hypothetical protein